MSHRRHVLQSKRAMLGRPCIALSFQILWRDLRRKVEDRAFDVGSTPRVSATSPVFAGRFRVSLVPSSKEPSARWARRWWAGRLRRSSPRRIDVPTGPAITQSPPAVALCTPLGEAVEKLCGGARQARRDNGARAYPQECEGSALPAQIRPNPVMRRGLFDLTWLWSWLRRLNRQAGERSPR